jgi:hypothetical protein
MNDKQILALARKNAAKSAAPKGKPTPKYDATLPAETDEGDEAQRLFSEMKKREF